MPTRPLTKYQVMVLGSLKDCSKNSRTTNARMVSANRVREVTRLKLVTVYRALRRLRELELVRKTSRETTAREPGPVRVHWGLTVEGARLKKSFAAPLKEWLR